MENVEIKIEGDHVIIRCNLHERHGLSKTGKSTRIASTDGFVSIAPGIVMNLNLVATKGGQ